MKVLGKEEHIEKCVVEIRQKNKTMRFTVHDTDAKNLYNFLHAAIGSWVIKILPFEKIPTASVTVSTAYGKRVKYFGSFTVYGMQMDRLKSKLTHEINA